MYIKVIMLLHLVLTETEEELLASKTTVNIARRRDYPEKSRSCDMFLDDIPHNAHNTTINIDLGNMITVTCQDSGLLPGYRTVLSYYLNGKRIYYANLLVTPDFGEVHSYFRKLYFLPESNLTSDKEIVVTCRCNDTAEITSTYSILYETTAVNVLLSSDTFHKNQSIDVKCIADGNPEPIDFEISLYNLDCKEIEMPEPILTESVENMTVFPPACVKCRAHRLDLGKKDIFSEFVIIPVLMEEEKEFPWWVFLIIGLLVALGLCAVALFCFLWWKRRKRKKRQKEKQDESSESLPNPSTHSVKRERSNSKPKSLAVKGS